MLAAERLEIVEKKRTPMIISRTPPLPTKYIRCPTGTADNKIAKRKMQGAAREK